VFPLLRVSATARCSDIRRFHEYAALAPSGDITALSTIELSPNRSRSGASGRHVRTIRPPSSNSGMELRPDELTKQ
jgi:hypothetical protein